MINDKSGVCTSIMKSDEENANIIKLILDTFLKMGVLEAAHRTEDDWSQVDDLPMNFLDYKYREVCFGLRRVFPEGHPFYDRIFYDGVENEYYDRSTDLYLDVDDLQSFGIK